jgi:hypothetical protein
MCFLAKLLDKKAFEAKVTSNPSQNAYDQIHRSDQPTQSPSSSHNFLFLPHRLLHLFIKQKYDGDDNALSIKHNSIFYAFLVFS